MGGYFVKFHDELHEIVIPFAPCKRKLIKTIKL